MKITNDRRFSFFAFFSDILNCIMIYCQLALAKPGVNKTRENDGHTNLGEYKRTFSRKIIFSTLQSYHKKSKRYTSCKKAKLNSIWLQIYIQMNNAVDDQVEFMLWLIRLWLWSPIYRQTDNAKQCYRDWKVRKFNIRYVHMHWWLLLTFNDSWWLLLEKTYFQLFLGVVN